MYRDAREILRERHRAAALRAARQLADLSPEDQAKLPEALRERLAAREAERCLEEVSAAAITSAENALDERERVLSQCKELLRKLGRDERRERRDRALEKVRRRLRWRPVLIALAGLVVLCVPAYLIGRVHFAAECRSSTGCRGRGDCTSDWRLGCVPGSDRDCKRSEDCRELGWCSLVRGDCIASHNMDCEQSEICSSAGACTARNNACWRDPR